MASWAAGAGEGRTWGLYPEGALEGCGQPRTKPDSGAHRSPSVASGKTDQVETSIEVEMKMLWTWMVVGEGMRSGQILEAES